MSTQTPEHERISTIERTIVSLRQKGIASALAASVARDLNSSLPEPWPEDLVADMVSTIYEVSTAAPTTPEQLDAERPAIEASGDIALTFAADEFVLQHSREVRFLRGGETWIVFDGKRWRTDARLEVERRCVAMFEGFTRRGLAERNQALERFGALRSSQKIRDTLFLAKSAPGIVSSISDFDTPKTEMLFNVLNGTVDLVTGELLPHDPEHRITRIAPVDYDPEAQCSRFMSFLSEIFEGDAGLVDYFLRALGYALTGSVNEQVFFLLFGHGANGKSTLLEVLRRLFGDYGHSANIRSFTASRFERAAAEASPDIAAFRGKRFVAAVEPQMRAKMDESKLKQLTGGDTLRARRLHEAEFEFSPECKLFLAVNHPPRVRDASPAFWRRVQFVPFNARFEGAHRDLDLLDKLLVELPGILAVAVRGCLEWQRGGLRPPESVIAGTAAYRNTEDMIGRFLMERTRDGRGFRVRFSKLREALDSWAEGEGETPPITRELREALDARNFVAKKIGGETWRLGLDLLPASADMRQEDSSETLDAAEENTDEQEKQDAVSLFPETHAHRENTFTTSCKSSPTSEAHDGAQVLVGHGSGPPPGRWSAPCWSFAGSGPVCEKCAWEPEEHEPKPGVKP